MATEPARIAHLLRRTTFGPAPGLIAGLDDLDYDAVLDAVLGEGPIPVFDGPVLDVPDVDNGNRGEDELIRWWTERMRAPLGGLHEKMVWYWHGHFTTSVEKCPASALAIQHRTVRRHALGNFRELARAMVIDPAMLIYLDGAGSQGVAPNENLARELMELFTVGPGNYSERDVKEAAKALSGWWVDWETGETGRDEGSAYPGAVRFLGRRGRFSPEEIVDALCDLDACPRFVADRIFRFLVGAEPEPEHLDELASLFRAENLEIAPLVGAIVRSRAFDDAIHARPRYPIEWFVHVLGALEAPAVVEDHLWILQQLDQLPFLPPNVAGWPEGDRWVSPSQMLARASALFSIADSVGDDGPRFGFDEDDPIPEVIARCGIHDPSEATLRALDEAYWAPFDAEEVNALLVFLALNSPDVVLA
ncbi:MAG: DUF1800 domain-containing protein [Actinomycetota bacterium]